MSHLGRPDGKVNPKYSLKPVVSEVEKLLGKDVTFSIGKDVEEVVNNASEGQVILLENLRFHAEEEGSSKDAEGNKVKADKDAVEQFRKGLTALGDVFISRSLVSCHMSELIPYQTMLLALHIEPTALWLASTCRRKRLGF